MSLDRRAFPLGDVGQILDMWVKRAIQKELQKKWHHPPVKRGVFGRNCLTFIRESPTRVNDEDPK